jgi:hypothetical protein
MIIKHYTMKSWGSECIDKGCLDLGTVKAVWFSFMGRSFYPPPHDVEYRTSLIPQEHFKGRTENAHTPTQYPLPLPAKKY